MRQCYLEDKNNKGFLRLIVYPVSDGFNLLVELRKNWIRIHTQLECTAEEVASLINLFNSTFGFQRGAKCWVNSDKTCKIEIQRDVYYGDIVLFLDVCNPYGNCLISIRLDDWQLNNINFIETEDSEMDSYNSYLHFNIKTTIALKSIRKQKDTVDFNIFYVDDFVELNKFFMLDYTYEYLKFCKQFYDYIKRNKTFSLNIPDSLTRIQFFNKKNCQQSILLDISDFEANLNTIKYRINITEDEVMKFFKEFTKYSPFIGI